MEADGNDADSAWSQEYSHLGADSAALPAAQVRYTLRGPSLPVLLHKLQRLLGQQIEVNILHAALSFVSFVSDVSDVSFVSFVD